MEQALENFRNQVAEQLAGMNARLDSALNTITTLQTQAADAERQIQLLEARIALFSAQSVVDTKVIGKPQHFEGDPAGWRD